MNNFKTDIDGGLPLELNDFRWIDHGIRDAFKGMMSAYGVTDQMTVRLSGCARNITGGGMVTIDPGYVSIGGEICFVPAQTYPVPGVGDFEYWMVGLGYDSEGLKEFETSGNHDTYETRTGKVQVSNVVPAGHTKYEDTKTIFEVIKANMPLDQWADIFAAGYDASLDYFLMGVPQSTRDITGFVHLRGCWSKTAPSSSEILGVLAVPDRPAKNAVYYIVVNGVEHVVTVKTNGEIVSALPGAGTHAAMIPLTMIPPFR